MTAPTTKQILGLTDLPPGVREALTVLSGGDRKMRAQEIKGKYESAMLNTDKVAAKIALNYVGGQLKHYRKIIAILDSIIEA